MTSSRPRVLVVDDESDLRELLRIELESQGWLVYEAHNGREAWRQLAQQPVDVVLSDLRMPGGSGLELATRLRDAGSPPPALVLMSAYNDVTAAEASSLGVQALLAKPFDFERVAEQLRACLPGA